MKGFFTALLGLAASVALPTIASADVVVGAWNINGVEQSLDALRNNTEAMREEVGPIDILIVEEVISDEQVATIADTLGLGFWAISDFSPPVAVTGSGFQSLEVGVISRFPIQAAMEWDTTGRQPTGDGFLPRLSDEDLVGEELGLELPGFSMNQVSRGFLRVDIDGDWTVYAVHWKSSRGESCNVADIGFARERETQAAGLVLDAAGALAAGKTIILGGDFNIQAPGNVPRSGTDKVEDCAPTDGCDGICGAGNLLDGYDDSIHSLFELGSDAALLTKDVDFTYVDSPFPGGAIDHLFVAGPKAGTFATATTPGGIVDDRYHGSDHRPVFSTSVERITTTAVTDRERIESLIHETHQRLDEIERLLQGIE